MAVKNTIVSRNNQEPEKIQFQQVIKSGSIQANIMGTLGDASKTKRFTASLISAVGTNPELQKCDAISIISAALLGESLNLSPSPQLGNYYLVPFEDKNAGMKKAVFQLGYKGYIQLAIRSGQYKKMNVIAVKEGELISFDPFNEEIEVKPIKDPDLRELAPTIGYYAMFELMNGFRKAMYWSKEKMIAHADKYSQAFSKDEKSIKNGKYTKVSYSDFLAGKYESSDAWLYSSFWYKDFDGMAYKTMLRQLISKWGIMSIEMQNAYANDMSFKETLSPEEAPHYSEPDAIDAEVSEAQPAVDAATGEVIQQATEPAKKEGPQTAGKQPQSEDAESLI